MKKLSLIFLYTYLLVACQSLPKPASYEAPSVYKELVSGCLKGEGSALVRIYDHSNLLATLNNEWIAWPEKGWVIETVSSFGQTLFRWNFDRASMQISSEGKFDPVLKKIQIEDGYLSIDGYFSGFQVDELPCLLMGKIPENWLTKVRVWRLDTHHWSFLSQQDRRTISVKAELDEQNTYNFCADVSWSQFMGLVKRQLRFCSSFGIRSMSGLGGYRVEIEDLDLYE